VSLRSASPHFGASKSGGYLGSGQSHRGPQNRSTPDFFQRRDDLELAGVPINAPSGSSKKDKTRPKQATRKDDQQRPTRCDIFADRLTCHFP
jgi:hypothetical protein